MVAHHLVQKYFHSCGDCRKCCDGSMFSMGIVTYSDFKKIIKIFPTAFDIKSKRFLFFYSLAPTIGCHYFRDGNCSIYDLIDRPDTCKNFPFGMHEKTIVAEYVQCPNLNDNINEYPILLPDKSINPKIMNDFFSEHQYVTSLNGEENIMRDFVELVFDSESLMSFPIFKTISGEQIDIKEIDANNGLMMLDTVKMMKCVRKLNNSIYESIIHGHALSLENLPHFGERLLKQL